MLMHEKATLVKGIEKNRTSHSKLGYQIRQIRMLNHTLSYNIIKNIICKIDKGGNSSLCQPPPRLQSG